ncbi:MAG: lysine--tRNA ligase [Geminicoccaceae bacterium]
MTMTRETYDNAKAWPFLEAKRLLERVSGAPPAKGYVLFQTGYGPSGLPHIGTFGEVFRTTMVRHAFSRLSDLPTELFCFSDDMDGLRKVPDNVPNRDMVAEHLGKPLTAIPDPFGTHESFGHHMNARLRTFLDRFGFAYRFKSATACYQCGQFNPTLLKLLEVYEPVRNVVLPVLGADRRATYSPILPVCPRTGQVLQVAIDEVRPADGTVIYTDPATGERVEVPVTDGHCKLQWRADWALRWSALDVDYEMYGKDLIDSAKLAGQITRHLGGRQPEGFFYELFLDENGEKISKSRGNGLTVDEWLTYGTEKSLELFMFQAPKKAKRLFFDVIPKHVDDYAAFVDAYAEQDDDKRLGNPVWHMHLGEPPAPGGQPISYGMLLNLATVSHAEAPETLWGFVRKYVPDATPENAPLLDHLIGYALAYYRDFVKPNKHYRAPTNRERAALEELSAWLATADPATSGDAVQTEVYEIGKRHGFEPLRAWFQGLYEVLLGESQGPRFGPFAEVYGLAETKHLIDRALAGEDLSTDEAAG